MQRPSSIPRLSPVLLWVLFVTIHPLGLKRTADAFQGISPSALAHPAPLRWSSSSSAVSSVTSRGSRASSEQLVNVPPRRSPHGTGVSPPPPMAFCRRSSTALLAASDLPDGSKNKNKKTGDDDRGSASIPPNIDDAYRLAMEEDEEWYNALVSDILGGEGVEGVPAPKPAEADKSASGGGAAAAEKEVTVVDVGADDHLEKEVESVEALGLDISAQSDNFAENTIDNKDASYDSTERGVSTYTDEMEDDAPVPEAVLESRQTEVKQPKVGMSKAKGDAIDESNHEVMAKNESDDKRINGSTEETATVDTDETEEDPTKVHISATSSKQEAKKGDTATREQKGPEKKSNDEDEDNTSTRYFIEYIDAYDRIQVIPLDEMAKLGYSPSDVRTMKADPLDIVLEDRIRRPKGGVPKRWTIQPGEEAEVKVLGKKEALRESDSVGPEDREAPSPRTRKREDQSDGEGPSRRKVASRRRDSDDPRGDRGTNRDPPDDEGSYARDQRVGGARGRGPPPPRRNRDDRRGDRAGPPPPRGRRRAKAPPSPSDTGIWMDLPTFREFLKREAQLRLSILGPGWAEAVKGESRWRLDLYEKWLDLVNEEFEEEEDARGSYVSSRRREQVTSRRRGPTPRQRREEWAKKRAAARGNATTDGQQGARRSPPPTSSSMPREENIPRSEASMPRSKDWDQEEAEADFREDVPRRRSRGQVGAEVGAEATGRSRRNRNRTSFGAIEEGIIEELEFGRSGTDGSASSQESRQFRRGGSRSNFRELSEEEDGKIRSPLKGQRTRRSRSRKRYSDEDEI